MSRAEIIGYAVAALAAGALYIIVHERRRKQKKAARAARDAPISKELLLQILNQSAEASKSAMDRVCALLTLNPNLSVVETGSVGLATLLSAGGKGAVNAVPQLTSACTIADSERGQKNPAAT